MKSLKLKIAALVLSTSCVQVTAQTTDSIALSNYNHETIYLSGQTRKYVKNNEQKRKGLFFKNLKTEFDSCSVESKQEMAKTIRNQKMGVGFAIGSGALFIGALAMPVVSIPIVASALIPYTVGLVNIYKANRRINKAVWLHNRDVVMK